MLKKIFFVVAFIFFATFYGFLFAENDGDEGSPSDEGSEINLLQVRDVVLKSTYWMDRFRSVSPSVALEAEILRDEVLVAVENFEGILEVDIICLSGRQSLHEEFYISGSGVYGMDVSILKTGYYKIELNLGNPTYVGKFSIEK
jgi:hypothetical protein